MMHFMNKRRVLAAASCKAILTVLLASGPALADDHDEDPRLRFVAVASGAQEVPANDSNARARLLVSFDPALSRAQVVLRVRDINSMVVAAHLHCNRAGLNGPVAFGLLSPGPLAEVGANTRVTLTNADAVGDCSGAIGRPVNNIASLYQAMNDGLIYLNVHTPDFPAGEVRGQLMPLDD